MTLINYLTGEVAPSHIKPRQQLSGRGSSFCAPQASLEAFPLWSSVPYPTKPVFPPWPSTVFFHFPSLFLTNHPAFPLYMHSLCLWRAQSFLRERKLQHLAVFAAASSFTYFPLPYLGECFLDEHSKSRQGLVSHFKGSLGTHPNGKHHINS